MSEHGNFRLSVVFKCYIVPVARRQFHTGLLVGPSAAGAMRPIWLLRESLLHGVRSLCVYQMTGTAPDAPSFGQRGQSLSSQQVARGVRVIAAL